jgi:hypothetical protein
MSNGFPHAIVVGRKSLSPASSEHAPLRIHEGRPRSGVNPFDWSVLLNSCLKSAKASITTLGLDCGMVTMKGEYRGYAEPRLELDRIAAIATLPGQHRDRDSTISASD